MNTLVIIGIVATAVGVIIAAMQWMFSNAEKRGASKQKIDDMHQRINAHDGKSIDCEKRFTQLEERKIDGKSIEDIRSDIMYIKTSLRLAFPEGSVSPLTQSHSPISLTELGKQFAERMDIESRVSYNWDKIFDFLESNLDSKNAYDIQQLCIETASVFPEKLFNDLDTEFLKNFAYSEGKHLAYYGSMIGVIIRDKYFACKGIATDEVDKHDPTQKQ